MPARITRHAGEILSIPVHPAPEDAEGAFGAPWGSRDVALTASSPWAGRAGPGRPQYAVAAGK